MRRNKLSIFLHLVWATWDRLPMITPEIERRLYREIESEAIKMQYIVLAFERYRRSCACDPHHANYGDDRRPDEAAQRGFIALRQRGVAPGDALKWQGSYGAFTVSRWDVDKIVAYVKNQKQHHADTTLLPEWEETYEEVAAAAESGPMG